MFNLRSYSSLPPNTMCWTGASDGTLAVMRGLVDFVGKIDHNLSSLVPRGTCLTAPSLIPAHFVSRVVSIPGRTTQVLYINQDTHQREDKEVLEGRKGSRAELAQEVQKKAILREIEAMTRLRSPHTVNLYGAVTSLPNRLILVMELMVGGDLQALLKNSEHALTEQQARTIIGDICAGMTFLHGKGTVHGDLKSANVLLDGDGRAKVRTLGGRG